MTLSLAVLTIGAAGVIPISTALTSHRSAANQVVVLHQAALAAAQRDSARRPSRMRTPQTNKHHHPGRPQPTPTPTGAPTVAPTNSATPTTTVAPTTVAPTVVPTSTVTTSGPTTTAAPTATLPATTPPATTTLSIFTGTPLIEQWAAATSPLYTELSPSGASAIGGQVDAAATDGKALKLTLPAGAADTPSHAAEVDSTKTFLYGSFDSRVRTAACADQPNTGAVTGIFTFGNDGQDHNGDGITDNSEIDVEILCARPDEINLTIWTDYSDANNAQKRVSRVIDMKSGKILSTCYLTSFDGDCQALTGAEDTPSTLPAISGFDSSTAYHDYRIDWSATRVVFTATNNDGTPVTLWDYQGPSQRIPHNPSAYVVNLWHTSDWTPEGSPAATAAPSAPLSASVDSSTVTPAS